MDTLKKIFPLSFNAADTKKFVINLLIYIFAPTVLGIVTGIIAIIPIIGAIIAWIVGAISGIFGLYCLVGLILLILVYAKVIK